MGRAARGARPPVLVSGSPGALAAGIAAAQH
jgi:hypothetical protein